MSEELSYAKAGVDIDVTDAAKREMAKSVDVDDDRVLNKLGAFASLLEGRFDGMKHPKIGTATFLGRLNCFARIKKRGRI